MTEWMKIFASNESSQKEESISSYDSSENIQVFDQSSSYDSDDEEEKQINVGKISLSPESFQFYFVDRLEKLKERRAAKEQKKKKCENVAQKEKIEQNEEIRVAEKTVKTEKVIEIEKVVEVEKIIEVEKIVEIIKPCLKCLESCKKCEEKDEKLSEQDKMKEKLLFDLNYVKESYDVLNRTVTGLQKTNSEREDALTMMNAVMMSKQKAINFYIEESAKWKQELETKKIENERIRRLVQSYSGSDYLIDRIYPTVAGLEVFQDEKPKKKDTGKKQSVSYNKCPPSIWEGYSPRKPNEEQVKKAVNIKLKSESTDDLPDNIDITFTSSDTDHESELIKKVVDQVLDKDEESESKSESGSSSLSVDSPKSSVKRVYNKEFLLSKSNLNNEPIKVAYTWNDSDKLYSDEEFPIRSVQVEKIKKIFKQTEINISEIKDVNLNEKPKKYTSRVQQRLNNKKGYSSGSGFQKKPNHNGNFKKKGLGFIPPENYKNEKIFKSKTKFVSGTSLEEEAKSSFWKQSNKEFLAKRQEGMKNGAYQRKETRTCFRCQEIGHIAWNCPLATKIKQEVVSKLKEKVVDKNEPPTEKFKIFKNLTYEVGECSKRFYKRRGNLDNQTWVVKKSDLKAGDESDFTKSEKPQFVLKEENSVPPMDEVNFPPLRAENLKSKVGKVEISNQFYSEKKEFDVEKAFSGNVIKIFGKMIDGKVTGVKDFYKTKKATYTPSEAEEVTSKFSQAWMEVFHK
ncbi:putative transcription factor interactor and regulator CCHC(Zn) family [Helianthus annuus]|nr:putative transcription factor interactor and regulator CCHC(Zn) family [Helianthus annuus]KAJ0938624.1 putative transcription factor interactor and regulator CCHC(Zn) family [Helianthus annuus]